MSHACTLKVNGIAYPLELDAGRTLLTVLRGELGLTGAKEGCDDSECGACMVLVDGRPVNSCSYLALHAGHADLGRGPAAPEPGPDRGGGAAGAGRQPVPLHRLPEDRAPYWPPRR